MLKQKLWDIPRSDKRDRCGICLHVLKRTKRSWRTKERQGYRFPKVGVCCRKIVLQKNPD